MAPTLYHQSMRWKQGLTPLDEVAALEEPAREALVKHNISTAEELLGLVVSSPSSLEAMLDLDPDRIDQLGKQLRQVIPSETVTAIDAQEGKNYALGALPPERKSDD